MKERLTRQSVRDAWGLDSSAVIIATCVHQKKYLKSLEAHLMMLRKNVYENAAAISDTNDLLAVYDGNPLICKKKKKLPKWDTCSYLLRFKNDVCWIVYGYERQRIQNHAVDVLKEVIWLTIK